MIKTCDTVSVTAAPQRVQLPEATRHYTLRNTGSSSAYYIQDPDGLPLLTNFAGAASALRTLGASELQAGEAIIIEPPVADLFIVCATGLTTTVQAECGVVVNSVSVSANIGNVGLLDTAEAEINPAKEDGNLATLAGSALTFARVPIDLAGTVWKDMATAGGATYARLHALVLTFSAAGTYRICSDDDGAGLNAVDLAGSTMYAGANGGIVVPFKAQKDACLVTPVEKHLSLYTSVAADGYAIVSVGA